MKATFGLLAEAGAGSAGAGSAGSRLGAVLAAVLLIALALSPFLWWGAMLIGMKLSCPMW